MLAVQVNSRGHRALTVMDEILFHAQTALLNQVQAYFKRHGKHEMNPLINVNSISELCDRQTGREQSVISVRA